MKFGMKSSRDGQEKRRCGRRTPDVAIGCVVALIPKGLWMAAQGWREAPTLGRMAAPRSPQP